jgi:hypothetical protein
LKTPYKAAIAAGVVVASMAGGALGASLIGSAGAQTSDTSPTTSAPAASGKVITPNTDPAHEATESPEREAAEQDGTATYGPGPGHGGRSNTDPTHEANESPERQAQEAAQDAQAGSGTTSTTGG